MKPVIIAEIGSSPAPDWNFDLWCLMTKRSGADAVKVQLWRADHFPANERASKRPFEFPRKRLSEFIQRAHGYGLRAGASVFDAEAVRLVCGECDFVKLAAREQYNADLLWQAHLQAGGRIPVYRSIDGRGGISQWANVINLRTIQHYPAPMAQSILTLLFWMRRVKQAGVKRWGWSSHTTGIADCVLAARLGAAVIEKHFCLSPDDLEGGHSLTPPEFQRMVERIRA